MKSKYSNKSSHLVDIKHFLPSSDLLPGFDQFLRDSYVYVKKRRKELERDEIKYSKDLD